MSAKLNRDDERQVREFTHRAIRSAQHDAIFCPLTLAEKHEVRVKPNFDTACWSYLPPHRIYVGMGIVARAKTTLSQAHLEGYVKSHVRHEFAHAHFTERDMRAVKKGLKKIKAPFQLFNLFEDARIEARYREEAEYQFDWLVYEDFMYSSQAESLLFAAIQAEGDTEKVVRFLETADIAALRKKQHDEAKAAQEKLLASLASRPETAAAALLMGTSELVGPPTPVEVERAQALARFARVQAYYQRIIEALDTSQLYPILEEWMAEFGRRESAPSRGCAGNGEASDLELGAQLQEDEDFRNEFDVDAEEVTSGNDASDGGAKGKAKAKPDENAPKAKKGACLNKRDGSANLDLVRVTRLAERFKKFFQAEARRVATATPQRKVSARHFAVGRPYYRVKQLMGKACQNLLMVVDLSGSMSGKHIDEGRVLLAALSRLARAGLVKGHILLSAGAPARWELFELPMSDETIARVRAFAGAEGLELNLKDHLALARDADYVFVYTDAQITDAPIDKTGLHRQGIFTWGLYVGEGEHYLDTMLEYFDKALIRDSVEALVDAMLIQKK
jgi:hypothetical protein